jgi:hypothetical protein
MVPDVAAAVAEIGSAQTRLVGSMPDADAPAEGGAVSSRGAGAGSGVLCGCKTDLGSKTGTGKHVLVGILPRGKSEVALGISGRRRTSLV